MNTMVTEQSADEFVAYYPPKSVGHGHHSRDRDPRKAWALTQKFLEAHAFADLAEPLKLTIWGPNNKWTDKTVSEDTIAEATQTFRAPPAVSGIFYSWELPETILLQALEFAFADDERPKQSLGPVSLYISYGIEWKTLKPPVRDKPRLYRHGSKLGVSVGGRKVFLQPTFLFGLPFQAPKLRRILTEIEGDLPFTMRDDFFQRVVPKKSGNGEKLVKLHKGWRSAI
jgi:hypothetical protein